MQTILPPERGNIFKKLAWHKQEDGVMTMKTP